MKRRIFDLALVLVLSLLPTAAAFAQTSSPTPTAPSGTPLPGMISPIGIDPISIKPSGGINGKISGYYGNPIPGASIVFSLRRPDGQTGQYFADHSTSKKIGPCPVGKTTDCIRADGSYTVFDLSLPQSDNPYDKWRTIDVRGEASGYVHWFGNQVLVSLDGTSMVQVQDVQIFETGFTTSQAYAWQYNDSITAVAFWARQNWDERVIIQFSFRGSSWTAVQQEYGMFTTYDKVGPGSGWIFKYFWTPKNQTANFGGSLCGTVQIQSAEVPDQVKADIKEVCLRLPYNPTYGVTTK